MLLTVVQRNLDWTETNPYRKMCFPRIWIENHYTFCEIREMFKAETEEHEILIEYSLLVCLISFMLFYSVMPFMEHTRELIFLSE
jgi:hypothetical protein